MAWTAPMTAIAGNILTAVLWNANVRDNFLECAPGKATAAGRLFVSTGANAIAERVPDTATIAATETTTTTASYVDLTSFGPSVTVASGTRAIIWFSALLSNNTGASQALCSYAISGTSTVAASDTKALIYQASANNAQHRSGTQHMETGLTAGVSNIITLKYKASANTASFGNRTLTVIPL